MNISKFLFKFVIICSFIIRLGLVILPVVTVGVLAKEGGWKYGFTFIQNNMRDLNMVVSITERNDKPLGATYQEVLDRHTAALQ